MAQRGSMRTHVASMHEAWRWACPHGECDYAATQKGHLAMHMAAKHAGERPFACEHCGQRFTRKGDLRTHVRSVHEGQRVQCEWPGCSKTFSAAGDMRKHLRVSHEGWRHRCLVGGCGHVTGQRGDMVVHIRRAHDVAKPRLGEHFEEFRLASPGE